MCVCWDCRAATYGVFEGSREYEELVVKDIVKAVRANGVMFTKEGSVKSRLGDWVEKSIQPWSRSLIRRIIDASLEELEKLSSPKKTRKKAIASTQTKRIPYWNDSGPSSDRKTR